MCASGHGSYSNGACTICAKGQYSAGGGTEACSLCVTGTTTADVGSEDVSECSLCSAGYGSGESGACTICEKGTYGVGDTTDACVGCPTSTTTPTNGSSAADECSLCAAGYGTLVGSTCTQCAVGTYSPGSTTADCVACSDGTTTTVAGSLSSAACSGTWL